MSAQRGERAYLEDMVGEAVGVGVGGGTAKVEDSVVG